MPSFINGYHPFLCNPFLEMSSSASSNKRSTWKRLRLPDPSLTSLCNQFAEMSISALPNKRLTRKRLPDPSVTSLCNQFAEMWKRKRIEYTNEMIEQGMKMSSSSSCAPKKEESSSNSCAPKKEESSSKSSEPKVMASTSTTPIQKRFKYDVFLSFRGEDTRNNFLGHLYKALTTKGIVTYKDDLKIRKGKTISDELIKAIEDSRFYIIVFSKNYPSSSWCLDELVKIIECQKKDEHTAYPVFYDVEPTEVRNQIGAVENAFSKNKEKEAAEKWKGALKEAANLAGWELNDGDESELIKKLVRLISLELCSISFGSDQKLVGMETRVKDVVDSLEMGIDDDVWMIGIKGMGGAGKTTTARAIFDRLSADFEAKSFVGNVREVSKGSLFGLKKLQEQVLSKVLNECVTLDSVEDGKNMMKRRMCGIKVLLVLDDVDHIDQLEALAGQPNWFKPVSKIIITTRYEQVLVAQRVNVCDIKVHDINLLSYEEAICLFSRYAFGRENPLQGYEELSGKVVRYAAGLPLTFKVLGSFLCGKDMVEWVDAIERLKTIPLKETMEILELSYIGLEGDYQKIFLDIACILKGQCKEDAIRILECSEFYARNGLKVLEQRSLITVDEDGCLGMHDHIEEMGKNIVRRSHPDEPNKHSQVWIKDEIEDILANDMGTEETCCLKLNKSTVNAIILMKGFGKMKKLRYLEVNFASYSDAECLDDTRQYFPNSLKYIKCLDYPFSYLPETFQANNLVGLEMKWSRMVQLWKDGEKKVLKKLKFLSLNCSDLTTFDFRMTPNLETLSLKYSDNLVELCMPVTCQKLKHLFISKSKLKTFDLELTLNLESLSLENCADFEELHVSVACPSLKFLDLSNSRLRSLDLELIPNLERLDLARCDELVKINAPAGCLKKVVSSLEMGIDDDVWMIRIKGMGGAGKTTTARAVFNRLANHFEAKSFVANVREVSKPSMSGLKKLQKQVLSDVMKEEVTVNDVTHGKNMMQKRMRAIKVLLVLDDVDHLYQLEALAKPYWFKPGSRIIITTRDEHMLVAHRVNFIRVIDLLSEQEAISLFSRYAFGREIPSQGYEELSGKVVQYAAGLPLTLRARLVERISEIRNEVENRIQRIEMGREI